MEGGFGISSMIAWSG